MLFPGEKGILHSMDRRRHPLNSGSSKGALLHWTVDRTFGFGLSMYCGRSWMNWSRRIDEASHLMKGERHEIHRYSV